MLHVVLRSVGGAFQIIGVASIVWELHRTRRQFGLSNSRWIRRLQTLGGRALRLVGIKKSPEVHAVGATAIASATAFGEARVIKSLKGQPVEVQIGILEERIEQMWETLPRKIGDEASQRVKADEEETRARIAATRQLTDAIQQAALGGFRIRGYGAVLIIVGTALVTWG